MAYSNDFIFQINMADLNGFLFQINMAYLNGFLFQIKGQYPGFYPVFLIFDMVVQNKKSGISSLYLA